MGKFLILLLIVFGTVGWQFGGGWDQGSVYTRYQSERATTSDTLTANESGKTISVDCTSYCTFSLPTAQPGMSYSFISEAAEVFSIDPATTFDTIRYATMSGGDKLTSPGAIADSVELFSTQANYWNIKTIKGTFVDGN